MSPGERVGNLGVLFGLTAGALLDFLRKEYEHLQRGRETRTPGPSVKRALGIAASIGVPVVSA
jgi:hypothetical protein